LEGAVAARTSELESELHRRAQMEVELRQAQKLEAVGQLASGIAHEINTPIQYVGDSLYFLREAFRDVMRLAERAADTGNDELDTLKVEVPEAFERTADGIRQVASIVKAMKTFAHTSLEKEPLDVNAAIHNTLTVSRNEYKYVADVEVTLADIPDVSCNAGGIRQVLLNLIVNAAHAIADVVAGSDARGKICVHTEQRGQHVRISVSDTGGGIPEAIRDRIFEPFFTTKEPGRGSGQGLAICQSLIKQHAGKLWFETELGAGTTFFVELPIDADSNEPERQEAA
jgi:signal transduction histidine kinase